MNRRNAAGVADRHALLTPRTYSGEDPSLSQDGYNATASPYENPYGPPEAGAPKKEAPAGRGYISLFNGSAAQQSSAAHLEEQNDSRLDALSERIKLLRDISTGIGNEVRESTSEMNSLNDVFSNASALLGNTFTRMNAMARRQRGWFCNMMLFLLFVIWVFAVLWWWRR
ncbi:hypothetical protein MVES_001198 [Malassezia vespertilionis]|uniref:t-SNARE coiled-coil homology domain-containing protein n=1 Tax=Malassezia vespertilionis TaxID=2020962 RepID=A0A2N1JE44_9BASI|nr:hypothetical protein MVES_001198 [Malassezia vespertilionis]